MSSEVTSRPPGSRPEGGLSYRRLDPVQITATAAALQQRISERLPEASLSRIAGELRTVAAEASETALWLARPHLPLRAGVGLAILLLLGVGVGMLWKLDTRVVSSSLADFLQGLDAAINEFVFLGLAIYFLLTLETRWKRNRAMKALHVLRSMAHIIDMHQLTKDPERLTATADDTPSSPKRSMTPFALTRYLDYCSEMLALISKVAALYVENLHDPPTLSAVNDIEELTSGLSRKIWQKIMILDRIMATHEQGR